MDIRTPFAYSRRHLPLIFGWVYCTFLIHSIVFGPSLSCYCVDQGRPTGPDSPTIRIYLMEVGGGGRLFLGEIIIPFSFGKLAWPTPDRECTEREYYS
jgi:hypothetical protein